MHRRESVDAYSLPPYQKELRNSYKIRLRDRDRIQERRAKISTKLAFEREDFVDRQHRTEPLNESNRRDYIYEVFLVPLPRMRSGSLFTTRLKPA